jgi:hypothetical protein
MKTLKTSYDAMVVWQKDIPTDHKILWFGGLDRQKRYAEIIDRYPTTYHDDALTALAMLPETYKQYRTAYPDIA